MLDVLASEVLFLLGFTFGRKTAPRLYFEKSLRKLLTLHVLADLGFLVDRDRNPP